MDVPAQWKVLLDEENRALTQRNIRILSWVGTIGMLVGASLDWFAYPQFITHFLVIRIACGVALMLLWASSFTKFGKRHLRIMMVVYPMMPVVSIAYMVYCTGDPGTPYYAGLCTCLVATGFLFQWSYVESLIATLITLAIYFCATIPLLLYGHFWGTPTFGAFVNNGIFLMITGGIIATGSRVHERIRNKEVLGRIQLAENRKELEQKNMQLVEADRMKTDFFSNITHELRTPLTLMIAPLQRLQRLYPPEAEGKQGLSEELGGIYDNALRLLKLINNLLDLASADAGRMRFSRQDFSLKTFSERLVYSVNHMAQQGGVSVHRQFGDGIDMVSVDLDKLEKILLNLLFNAVKFTPTGGAVTLVTQESDGHIIFEVADTGVGISAKNLPFIFDRFWQADSSATRRHPGTGLGLALVKELVEMMSGQVSAESEIGKGTTMRVSIPIERQGDLLVMGMTPTETNARLESASAKEKAVDEQAPETAETPSAPDKSGSAAWIQSVYREAEHREIRPSETSPGMATALKTTPILPKLENDGQKPLLLIVDDDAGMLNFMRTELEGEYRIMEASDGEAALHLAEAQCPDLVISDYMMPNLDGLSFCRILRSRTETRMTPVMLVTARSDEEVRLTALRNGANDVLVKPFSLTEFHTRVHNLVHAGILQKQLEMRNAELVRAMEELRAAERDLIQSEKMASLGILTGGIMHEINNPLNFARSALYVLQRKTVKLPEDKRTEYGDVLTDIGESISRISAIISDLRTFCHPESAMASSCPLVEPLQSAVRILAAPLKDSQVEVHETVLPDLLVRGDRNQLTLVFLNLIKNAIDALGENGHDRRDRRGVWVTARPDGGVLEVRVKDNGPGIAGSNLAKVFDPFFTTKPAGEGTGLGLSMCYRIVTAHGGAINVHSEEGKGTEFVMRLPVAVEPARIHEDLALTS